MQEVRLRCRDAAAIAACLQWTSAFCGGGDAAGPADSALSDAAIVVTAERRHQSVQRIPVPIAAFSGPDIEQSHVSSVMEMQKLVPGLVVTEASTGHGQLFMRGIGTDIVGAGVEGAVSVFVDGVYQSRAIGETMQFIDVDRVEVLKGPQGVMYGRNATGGAVNIISKPPSASREAEFDVQAGSYGQRRVRGTASGPLSGGAANGRLSVLWNRDDGDTRNLLLGIRANARDVRGIRAALELSPGAGVDAVVSASHYREDSSPVMKAIHPAVNPLFTGFHATVVDDPRAVMANMASELSVSHSRLDLTARWDVGASRLTSITAVDRTDYNARKADLDGTEIPALSVGSPTTGTGIPEVTTFISQDFTLNSRPDGPLRWTGLLSFSHQDVDADGFNFRFPLLNLTTDRVARVKTDAFAFGGQGTYALADGLHLTAGARYSSETKNLESLKIFANGVLLGTMADKKRWSALTPKLVLDYAPGPNAMLYVSATKGFKSGGYNTVAIQPAFGQETAINYEAGIKSRWADGRVLANVSAFHTRYEDMQVAVVLGGANGLTSVIANAAKAVSKGIEASIKVRPTPHFEVDAAFQFLHARFAEFVSIDNRNPGAGAVDQKGNPLSRAPDRTASLALQYRWPLSDGAMAIRVEDSYRSKIYYTPFKNDYASSPPVSVANAMVTYEPPGKAGWHGSAFVKNLTNRTYTINVFDPQSLGYLALFAPARTVGVQVGYRY